MSSLSHPYNTLQHRCSQFTEEEDEFIFQRAETSTPSCVGALPYFECWKTSRRWSGSVLKCQQRRTNCDVMLTFCVEDHQSPVNLIVDVAFNGVGSMHAALVKHYAGSLDPDADNFEYSCLVRSVAANGTMVQERRVLSSGVYDHGWLMHGHIVDVAKKPTKTAAAGNPAENEVLAKEQAKKHAKKQAKKQAVQKIVAAIDKGDLDRAVAALMTHPTTGKAISYGESRMMYG